MINLYNYSKHLVIRIEKQKFQLELVVGTMFWLQINNALAKLTIIWDKNIRIEF